MTVSFVNCFEVPAGQEDAFLGLFQEVNAYMAAQPGYVSHRLHRSLRPDVRFRFINYAEWESPEHWRAAHGDGFRELISRPGWARFSSTPALYEIVREGEAPAAASR